MFNSNDIRQRLHAYMIDHPISFQGLALEVNINQQTLKNFIQGTKVASSKTLARIENFLRSKLQV